MIARLADEDRQLKAAQAGDGELRAEAARALQACRRVRWPTRRKLPTWLVRSFRNSRHGATPLAASIEEQKQRIARLEREAAETTARRQGLLAQMGGTGDGPTLAARR